ncbi:MAG: class I SAM-dependent methyltransferase [Syntrophomonadaceae bacterium]|jgi:16S rRNA (guanine1516-N2)-methyltransferase
MKIVATTTQSREEPDVVFRQFLIDSGFEYVPRRRGGLKAIREEHQADAVLVWQPQGPVLHLGDNKLFFHPSMAKIRLAAYRNKGQVDPLIEAARVEADDAVLDCTLGLGADSIVLAYFARAGEVLSLESSPAIAYTIKWGMRLYQSSMPWLDEAIHRVKVKAADHLSYLQNLPDNCYDIVYFDPMFRNPLLKSETLSPIRVLGNTQALTEEAVNEGRRVARKRVVIKERAQSTEFARLGCHRIAGSIHNQVHFGIIDNAND